ncbi:hypothetical protein NXG04_07525 [Klebsiella pneumoniae]|nr:hypothetical protein [Klebsiella pneumoniae]MDS7714403.1 hypothetical protein [Klebsiella pneumoniae]UUV46283.1 hypothetical protein [Bacillus phage vB_BanS-Thrax2]
MYLARFLETTYEQKYAKRHDRYLCEDNWYVAYPTFGHRRRDESEEVRLFRRVKERDVIFFEEKTSFHFDVDDNVRVNGEVVKVTKVIKTLDGAIEYYTDRNTATTINTRETFFDERDEA